MCYLYGTVWAGSSGRARRAAVVAASLAVASCGGSPVAPRLPLFSPSRIVVQEIVISPEVAASGAPVHIRFRLVRTSGGDEPIYWTSSLVERPRAGGVLEQGSGGPLLSGEAAEIVYRPAGATTAAITVFPASAEGRPLGDGSGDWSSVSIPVAGGG